MNDFFNKLNVYYSAVSNGINTFKERFNKKFNLKTLDPDNFTSPCVFFGIYTSQNINKYLSHHGKKYILYGGTDINIKIPFGKRNALIIKQFNITNILVLSKKTQKDLKEIGIDSTYFNMNLVDKSLFYPRENKKPSKKIYVYNGFYKIPRPTVYGGSYFKQIVEQLPQFELIFSSNFNLPYVKMPNIYNSVFIVLRLTSEDGNANTIQEAEAMGVPAVHNISDYGLKWNNVTDITNHIKKTYENQFSEEEKKILR